MPFTRSADLRTAVFDRPDALPAGAGALFDAAPGFFASRPWWEAVLAHALPPGAVARFVLIEDSRGTPCAVFPMLFDPGDGEHRSLTTGYTCLYEPLFAPDLGDRAPVYAAFARACRGHAVTRLDALDGTVLAAVAKGARRAGLAVAAFDHFGNWHEDVSGLDWPGYLARRPGALRETVRRRTRRAERLAEARVVLYGHARDTGAGGDLDAGIAAFEAVYARSWKEPEPFPAINPAQIRAAASLGIARLGVWFLGDVPVASQFWIVENGQATVLKLAHDEAYKTHSPGTVLSAWMIRHMLEHEGARALDFGRGDDPYKKDWVSERRQRMGLLLINPLRPRGAVALARHLAGRARMRLRPLG